MKAILQLLVDQAEGSRDVLPLRGRKVRLLALAVRHRQNHDAAVQKAGIANAVRAALATPATRSAEPELPEPAGPRNHRVAVRPLQDCGLESQEIAITQTESRPRLCKSRQLNELRPPGRARIRSSLHSRGFHEVYDRIIQFTRAGITRIDFKRRTDYLRRASLLGIEYEIRASSDCRSPGGLDGLENTVLRSHGRVACIEAFHFPLNRHATYHGRRRWRAQVNGLCTASIGTPRGSRRELARFSRNPVTGDGMSVVDFDPIPLADTDERMPAPPSPREAAERNRGQSASAPSKVGTVVAIGLIVLLCSLHGAAIWRGMGGIRGMTSGWPLWRDDHPLYYHSALVTRSFLRDSRTTAGYDPSFMAGYAKSVVYPTSSTLPELVVALFGGEHPEFAYKVYVLVSAAAVPWLIALALRILEDPADWSRDCRIAGLALHLDRLSDQLRRFRDAAVLSRHPAGIGRDGRIRSFSDTRRGEQLALTTGLMSMAFLVHLTTAMVIVPAATLSYFAAVVRGRRPHCS